MADEFAAELRVTNQPGRPSPTSGAVYTERLWPGPGAWAIVPIGAISCAFVLAPFGVLPAVAAFVITAVMMIAAFVVASPRIEIRDGQLQAGRARIETGLLGDATGFRAEPARQERGPRLDARAYLLLRGWVDPVVRVELNDANDPTPYWLLSTRHPDELVAALSRAQ